MIRYRETGWFALILLLQFFAQPVVAEESSGEYHYSDEWSVVSAPPPSGPYRSVNIDPRVPGAGTVAPLPMNIRPLETLPEATSAEPAMAAGTDTVPPPDQPLDATRVLPEETMDYPPAAGIAVPQPETVTPTEAVPGGLQQQPALRMPVPGYYGRTMPAPPSFGHQAPGYYYPPQAGYPGYHGYPGYSGYQNAPPTGYYNPPLQTQEPEVPPPPSYEPPRGYRGMR